MKIIRTIIALGVLTCAIPATIKLGVIAGAVLLAPVGCKTAPSERVQVVTTLKALGAARDTAMQVAGQLWLSGKIDDAQRDKIIDFHDNKFQPAYRIAVAGVQADLTLASPDLVNLFAQLQALIPSYL